MKITRRTLLGTIAAGFAAGPFLSAFAEGDWPSRIVRLVSPYGAGGASDISLRILAEQFGRSLNQQFIVENKPGAGTRVANELVSRAAPDGYTFLYAAAPFATAEALFEKPFRDVNLVTMQVRQLLESRRLRQAGAGFPGDDGPVAGGATSGS